MTNEEKKELLRKVNCTTDVQEACLLGFAAGFKDGYRVGAYDTIKNATDIVRESMTEAMNDIHLLPRKRQGD